MKEFDVVALGELLIDFTENGVSGQGNPIMEANPGGAPCNVLALLTKHGHSTGFVGKVGKDMFGNQLQAALEEVGISTRGLILDEEVHTTLAFVHTFPDGDRDFSFYRNPGADMMLSTADLDVDMIQNATIFHYGSLSMTDEICRQATLEAIRIAEESGAILSYDPNLREPLWSSLDLAKERIKEGMKHCQILKISDNEIQWLTGLEDYDEGIAAIRSEFPNLKLVLASLGRDGSIAYCGEERVFVPAFVREDTIETTGAGDTFCGSVLHYVLEHGLKEFAGEELKEMLTYANAVASIVTTRKGALRVMPAPEEVQKVLCVS